MKKFLSVLIIISVGLCLPAADSIRAVSLAPALTETAVYLGAFSALVGRSTACDYPPEVKKLPVTGHFGRPELEKILALKPDLVMVNDVMNSNILRKLQSLNITVKQQQIRNVDDYLLWVDFMGKNLNCQTAAGAEKLRTKKLQQQLSAAPPLPIKVLWIVNYRPMIVAGRDSLPDYVLKLCGVKNAADIFDQEYVKISAEWLLSTPLDMIILPETDIKLREERIWRQVDAVKKSRIIFHAAADPLTRPGPRWLPAVINLRKNIEALHSAIKKE